MKFLKYFCAASLLAASAGTLWSCDDDDDKRLSDAVLASVSSLTFEAQDTSEKIITVYADADWVTEIPDWVTVTPTEGTGVMDVTVSVSENMRDGAMDNPRKAKLVFKGRTLASRAEVLVSQVGNKFRDIPEYQKIGDVIEVLCEGYDPDEDSYYGRTYADSPDIDGKIWFTAEKHIKTGDFVDVHVVDTYDGELVGVLEEEYNDDCE